MRERVIQFAVIVAAILAAEAIMAAVRRRRP